MATTAPIEPKHPGYHIDLEEPLDAMVERNWPVRWANLGITCLVILIVLTKLGHNIAGSFGVWIALLVTGGLYIPLIRNSFIDVSDWHAYGTIDRLFGGKIVTYGPGLHISHWWENRLKRNNASLKPTTKSFKITVPTKTSAVIAEAFYQFAGDINRLPNFLGIRSMEVIDEGFKGFLESFLYVKLAEGDSDQATASVNAVNQDLEATFQGKPGEIIQLEHKYGLITTGIGLKGITHPEDVQKARDGVDEMKRIFTIMAGGRGVSAQELSRQIAEGEISEQELISLRTAAMVTAAQGGTTIESIQLPGLLGGLFGGNQGTGKKK